VSAGSAASGAAAHPAPWQLLLRPHRLPAASRPGVRAQFAGCHHQRDRPRHLDRAARIPTGKEPHHLYLTPDEKSIIVANARAIR
jgi:hypothetical protein